MPFIYIFGLDQDMEKGSHWEETRPESHWKVLSQRSTGCLRKEKTGETQVSMSSRRDRVQIL